MAHSTYDLSRPRLPLEVLLTIAELLADDPWSDNATLKACSLAFPSFTTLFQFALASRKETVIILSNEVEDSFTPTINRLLGLLQARPLFGESVAHLKILVTQPEALKTVSPDICSLLSLCTKLRSFSFGLQSMESMPLKRVRSCRLLGENIFWILIPKALRSQLERIALLPSLETLEFASVAVPWTLLLTQMTSLNRLTLTNASNMDDPKPQGLESNTARIHSTDPGVVTIHYLKSCPSSADSLTNAIMQQVRTFENSTRYQSPQVHHLTFGQNPTVASLAPMIRLKTLILNVDCTSPYQSLYLFYSQQSLDSSMQGLFKQYLPARMRSLECLVLQGVILVERGPWGSRWGSLKEELAGAYPEDNKLKKLTLEMEINPACCPPRSEWQLLLASLTRDRFPCLEDVCAIVDFQPRPRNGPHLYNVFSLPEDDMHPDSLAFEELKDALNKETRYPFTFMMLSKGPPIH